MKAVLHDDESGVSEVIGTIMILGITVVLFSTIILWVTSIPTPTTQTRVDMESTMNPVYSTSPPYTEIAQLRMYNPFLATPNGLIDGNDAIWSAGERWAYKSFSILSTDQITVMIVDLTKSAVVWSSPINGAGGPRPPIFVEKWVDGVTSTSGIDPVQERLPFALYARVIALDGNLNRNSVFMQMSIWFGTGSPCEKPI